MYRIFFACALFLGTSMVLRAQESELSFGLLAPMPLGHSSHYFTAGGGPSIGFERPLSDLVSVDLQLSYCFLGVADPSSDTISKAAIVPLNVGVDINPGRYAQHGLYGRAQIGYHTFIVKEQDEMGYPTTSEVLTGVFYYVGFGAGVGYHHEFLDGQIVYDFIVPSAGIAGQKLLDFLSLRFVYVLDVGN